MADEQVNEALIKEVKLAVNNVANAYNGAFQIKEDDEGTDRISNCTLRLTSKEWKKDAQIKFSIDRPSEFLGEPDDPLYFACCKMGVLLDRFAFDGFAGAKYSYNMSGKKQPSVGKFVEQLFLPTAIEILKFQKAKKAEVDNSKLKKLFSEMWSGTLKKVPTEEQISQLFFESKTNESISETPKQTMKTQDIKNELVKKVIKTALQNKFKVTIANINTSYGTPFRIKKGSMLGWDILFVLARLMKTTSNDLLDGNGEGNNPRFFIYDDCVVVTDPEMK